MESRALGTQSWEVESTSQKNSVCKGTSCESDTWGEFGPLEAALRMPLLVTENEKGGQEVSEGRGTVCVGWLSVLKP